MPTRLFDSYVHKTVERNRKDASLKFLTSQSLFSSNAVDVGSNLLLRVIADRSGGKFASCLDLGCGYGVLGISLGASGLAETVEMVDRDALAVEFASANVEANRVGNVETHASLGLDDAFRDRYDLVVSNLPGKAGPEVLRHFLVEALNHLTLGGQFWGVVVNPLWPQISRFLDELNVTPIHVEQAARHTVFGFDRAVSLPYLEKVDSLAEIYSRDSVEFTVGRRVYTVHTSRGVDEFDGLAYSTRLMLEQLNTMRNQRWDQVVFFNVSQGYVPIALRSSGMARSVQLVDRDLLALRTSERNLLANNLDTPPNRSWHQSGWLPEGAGAQHEFGLIAGILRGDEPRQTLEIGIESIADRLQAGGTAVVAGGSTPITRMLKVVQARKDVQLADRNRYRGSSVFVMRKVS